MSSPFEKAKLSISSNVPGPFSKIDSQAKVSSKYSTQEEDLDFDLLEDIYKFDSESIVSQDEYSSSTVDTNQSVKSSSQIEDYFEYNRQHDFNVSTVKILDDVYDKYLLNVPQDLLEALKLGENAKIEIIGDLFANRILTIEQDLAETEDNLQMHEYYTNIKTQILKQRSEVERYINACIFERLLGEKRFKFLRNVQPSLENKLEAMFKPVFQKNLFDNESQIHVKFKDNFIIQVEQEFEAIVQEELNNIVLPNLQGGTSKFQAPQFMMNYLLSKSKEYLTDLKNEFIKAFQTSYEDYWQQFVQLYHRRDRLPEFDPDNLQVFFNILIRLPVNREVKLDIIHLESKVCQFAFQYDLTINIDELWTQEEEIEAYIISLHTKLEALNIQSEKENFLNTHLYIIFHYFITQCYTAGDRQLLKEFLQALQSKVNHIVMQDKKIKIWFYLSIFEREFASFKEKDEYMLKDLALVEFKDELRKLGIDELIYKASILNLKKISSYQSKSRHVVICISGFLTEDVEKTESWGLVINHYKYAEVFALNWNSLSLSNFWKEGHYKEKGKKSKFMGKLFFIKGFKKQFRYALDQTKVAGTMLAMFLMKYDFCADRAISLIGHSLGTVIILQCLNVLHHFYKQGVARAARIIHDVFFWGGAAVLNPKNKREEVLQKAKICGIINGKLSNVYSLKDYILKYTFLGVMSSVEPIGLIPIFKNVPDVVKSKDQSEADAKYRTLKRAQNFDCTIECPGHTTYSTSANLVLEKIPNSF